MTVTHRRAFGARQMIAVLGALALALALMPATTAAAEEHEGVCADVDPEDVPDYADRDDVREAHLDSVDCVMALGISLGADSDPLEYGPLAQVTRGQLATFIVGALGHAGVDLSDGSGSPGFTDTAGTTHEGSIDRLAEAEIVGGFADGSFQPGASILRQAMATFMVHGAEYALDQADPDDAPHDLTSQVAYFADVLPTNVHFGNINGGFETEPRLFQGTTPPTAGSPGSGEFTPAGTVLRDAMATFVVNLLDFLAANLPAENPAPWAIELTGDATAGIDEPVEVTATVTDAADEPVEGASVDFEVEGPATPVNGVAAAQDSVDTDAQGEAVFEFTPEEGGVYTITGSVTDPDGDTATDTHEVVVGLPI